MLQSLERLGRFVMVLRAQLINLEGKHRRLARIAGLRLQIFAGRASCNRIFLVLWYLQKCP